MSQEHLRKSIEKDNNMDVNNIKEKNIVTIFNDYFKIGKRIT